MWGAIIGSNWKSATGLFLSLIVAPHVGDVKIDAGAQLLESVGAFLAAIGVGQKVVKWIAGIVGVAKARPRS